MIQIAKNVNDKAIGFNLDRLIETRMLVQANSGGGKSWLLRRVLEATHGKVQQIVLDMEGEFSTLRERYDYILAGKGGDVAADPKTADLLARKTLELGVSLIVDLYELKQHERIRFVRNFCDALVNSPKDLWHPVLVVIDEAHVFVPEKGESEAASAVVDLATRGRKRGFCVALATQRLSKLHKDVAAECLNKMIGRTSLDIDRKRAGDELGFLSQKDSLALRQLQPGQFYFFGPAISNDVQLGKVETVQTSHPRAGQRIGVKPAAPTEKIKAVLAKLADLPKEAEEELRDRSEMKSRIKTLERELYTAQKSARIEKVVEKVLDEQAIDQAVKTTKREMLTLVKKDLEAFAKAVADHLRGYAPPPVDPRAQRRMPEVVVRVPSAPVKVEREGRTFGTCERKILGFLSLRPGEFFTKVQVGAMTGYSHGSGGFNNALSNLAQAGLILRNGAGVALNPEADVSSLIDSTPHRLQDWVAKLGSCERKIYEQLLESPDTVWRKEEIADATGYSAGSGGFNNSISRLSTLGLLRRGHGGTVQLNPEVSGIA